MIDSAPVARISRVVTCLWLLALAAAGGRAGDLDGKLVVLDPGHGGSASGAVAPRGLRECDLNLQVSHHVRERLVADGALVVMTRVTDTDCRIQETFDLREDLVCRAHMSNHLVADAFVSLHHNAFGQKLSGTKAVALNRTEIYYNMFDQQPSRSLGLALFEELDPLLRARTSDVFPSAFAVLRFNERPAVLGEPFYMTGRLHESYARDPRWIQAEASRYHQGIRRYLARTCAPAHLVRPIPGEVVDRDPVEVVVAVPPGLDDPTVSVTVSGLPVIVRRGAPGTFLGSLPGLENGDHEVVAWVQDKDRHAPTLKATFAVDLPPARVEVRTVPRAVPPGYGGPMIVRALVFDGRGRPVRDGTGVTIFPMSRPGPSPAPAPAPLRPGPTASVSPTVPVTGETREGQADLWIASGEVAGITSRPLVLAVGSLTREIRVEPLTESLAWAEGRFASEVGETAVDDVDLIPPAHHLVSAAVQLGSGRFMVCGPARRLWIRARHPGYLGPTRIPVRPRFRDEAGLEVLLRPVLGGAFHGQSIILDTGDPGSCRQLFERLRELLEDTGIRGVYTTETAAASGSVKDRVLAANQTPGRIAITFTGLEGGRGGPVTIQHYHASPPGRSLAAGLKRSFEAAGIKARVVGGGSYFINNTPATALELSFAGGSPVPTDRLAYIVYRGLASGLAPAGTDPRTLSGRLLGPRPKGPQTWVYLDNGDRTLADASGRFVFHHVEPRVHQAWHGSRDQTGYGRGVSLRLDATHAPREKAVGRPGRKGGKS